VIADLLPGFETLAIGQHPLLASKLQEGLSEDSVRRYLKRHRVEGELGDIVAVYTWRNGTRLDPELAASKRGFFPGKPYYLLDLEMAVGHLEHTRVAARKRPQLAEGVSYFPLFWDGSTSWIATDTRPLQYNRVVLAEHRAEVPFREANASLRDFFIDVIKALEENRAPHLASEPR
jgi:hypothetical protein